MKFWVHQRLDEVQALRFTDAKCEGTIAAGLTAGIKPLVL